MDEHVLEYVKENLAKGFLQDEITKNLLLSGISEDDIQKAFDAIEDDKRPLDPVIVEAGKELRTMKKRFDEYHTPREAMLPYTDWRAKLANKNGMVNFLVRYRVVRSRETAVNVLLGTIALSSTVTLAAMWLLIIYPAFPHPVNAPARAMDCHIVNGAVPNGCH